MNAVLMALRLIRDRAAGNGREEITLGDVEWAIQEMERELSGNENIMHNIHAQDAGQS